MTTYGPGPTVDVRHAVMEHLWGTLTFLHWRYPVEQVQALLPDGLTVQAYDGSAWVGLVPFRIEVRPPHLPAVPWASRFPETNVRTYVTDSTGRAGIWFFSLDAARLGAVVAARSTYGLPYFWAAMQVEGRIQATGDEVTYTSLRRWPGPRGAHCRIHVRVGEAFAPEELGELDHFLTARWTLYSAAYGLTCAHAHHRAWSLRRAELVHLDESLVRSAGLAAPAGTPLLHCSPGVQVRIGAPHRAGRPSPGAGSSGTAAAL
jgi:uncharacterized protein YqjF (DUF2071 family)